MLFSVIKCDYRAFLNNRLIINKGNQDSAVLVLDNMQAWKQVSAIKSYYLMSKQLRRKCNQNTENKDCSIKGVAFWAETGGQLTSIFQWNKDFLKYQKPDLKTEKILEALGFSIIFHFPKFTRGPYQ